MKKLIVLDLDETLIHALESPLGPKCDFEVDRYYVYKRPHLHEFIDYCLASFEVAVWTSSTSSYASEIVERIFPSVSELKFVFARDKCTHRFDPEFVDYYYLKDLKKVKKLGFKLSNIIAIDDSPEKFNRHYGNLVRVKPFEGNSEDNELLKLIKYLEILKSAEDIRVVEKRGWHVNFNLG